MEEIALVTKQHVKHAKSWIVSGYSLPKLCIACVIFRLERKGETDICCKKILEELLAILSSGSGTAFAALSSDSRVLQHLANVLFGEQHKRLLSIKLIKRARTLNNYFLVSI